jgi:hypothetical protein
MCKQLPNPVISEYETNEGYIIKRRDDEIIEDLVCSFNDLLEYLKEVSHE